MRKKIESEARGKLIKMMLVYQNNFLLPFVFDFMKTIYDLRAHE